MCPRGQVRSRGLHLRIANRKNEFLRSFALIFFLLDIHSTLAMCEIAFLFFFLLSEVDGDLL